MKKLVITLTILGFVGALAAPVLAYGGGRWAEWFGGPGYCWQGYEPYSNLTDSQRAELGKIEQKFYNDTAKLREEIWAKSAELNTILNTANPEAAKVRALQKKISDLRAKLDQQRIDFELETRKVAPNADEVSGYTGGHGWPHMMGGFHGSYGGYGMHKWN